MDTLGPRACMADFVRVVDVGPFWERSILWYQFAGFEPWWSILLWTLEVDFTLWTLEVDFTLWTLVVDFVWDRKE